MTFAASYALIGGILLVLVTGLWWVSLVKKDASIIDPWWSLFFAVATGTACLAAPGPPHARGMLLLTVVAVWSLRLAVHLFRRAHGHGEDFRYRAMRENYRGRGNWSHRAYVTVFLLQGLLAWILCVPLVSVFFAPATPLGIRDGLALVVWGIGFAFEALGDAQLARFRADTTNRDRVLDHGVWRYTRHPNYFGDAAQWWGFYLLAAAHAPWTVYAPVLMTWLLLRISGVPLLEADMRRHKPAYAAYAARTSAFLPLPPKKQRPASQEPH